VQRIHNDTAFDSIKLNARVIAMEKLELAVGNRPDAVIVGESYKFELRLSNRGNPESTVKLSVKGNPDDPMEASPSPQVLKPEVAKPWALLHISSNLSTFGIVAEREGTAWLGPIFSHF
jgi:hypothetical protein